MVPAKWFRAGRVKPIRLIVIHCTVSREMGTGAEAVANYFARGDRRASTHRVSDNNSTVICVRDEDTAFGAAGANADGLHLELVGMPDQSLAQWLDPYSDAELREAGSTIREWSARWGIPLRWLSVAEVADGRTRGICTHHDISRAFPEVSTGHWDPGPNFPKAEALRLWTPSLKPTVSDPLLRSAGPMILILRSRGVDVLFDTESGFELQLGKQAESANIAGNTRLPVHLIEVEDAVLPAARDAAAKVRSGSA